MQEVEAAVDVLRKNSNSAASALHAPEQTNGRSSLSWQVRISRSLLTGYAHRHCLAQYAWRQLSPALRSWCIWCKLYVHSPTVVACAGLAAWGQ